MRKKKLKNNINYKLIFQYFHFFRSPTGWRSSQRRRHHPAAGNHSRADTCARRCASRRVHWHGRGGRPRARPGRLRRARPSSPAPPPRLLQPLGRRVQPQPAPGQHHGARVVYERRWAIFNELFEFYKFCFLVYVIYLIKKNLFPPSNVK